ncbi:MAG: methionine--tRNA ligase [Deltaproteobacteria bacterium]|jgi:methionyl-tRNA synthetase|nr:methionine--tRNA ligase [Deltaproteobacteria bacterium]
MKHYITTPIFYVNARPHLGHAYTTITNDILSRFHRLAGYETHFLTGTDEHGDKIAQAAAKANQSPQAYADQISALFREAWPNLSVEVNDFIRTTEPRHKDTVARFFDLVNKRGEIYFGEYGGHYCFGCERFYTEKELVNGLCPDHQTKPQFISEKNYFFRMGNYQQWLIDHLNNKFDFIRPEGYRSEVLGFLREPLEDLCVTRPKSRLTWGIDVPFDNNFVTYVWFDALINYISALDWPNGEKFHKFWPVAQHTIAKDILKPHAIFWPTMLKAADQPLYRHLNVHGYWRIGQSKMSKSVGNVVEALSMAEKYGSDAFRYFLAREMTFGLDSEFSEDRLVDRYNADLANDLGNLCQRALAMLKKFSSGRVPVPLPAADDDQWLTRLERLRSIYESAFLSVNPRSALTAVWDLIGFLNKSIDSEAPWALAKDPDKKDRLDTVLARLAGGLAYIGALIWPVMPKTAVMIWSRLGMDPYRMSLDYREVFSLIPRDKTIEPGLGLFPRVETETELKKGPKPAKIEGAEEPVKVELPENTAQSTQTEQTERPLPEGLVTIGDFQKIELRVAEILAAEKVKGSNKLIKLNISLGTEERVIAAGIGKHYAPEDLVGLKVIVVVNLVPAKLMGITSQGMLLAASLDGQLAILTPHRPVPVGSKVS